MALELEQVEQLEFLDTDTPAEVEAEAMEELEASGEEAASETDSDTDSTTTEEWPDEIVETVEPEAACDDLLINCPYAPTIGGDWEAVDAWVAGWLWGDRQIDGNGADAAG